MCDERLRVVTGETRSDSNMTLVELVVGVKESFVIKEIVPRKYSMHDFRYDGEEWQGFVDQARNDAVNILINSMEKFVQVEVKDAANCVKASISLPLIQSIELSDLETRSEHCECELTVKNWKIVELQQDLLVLIDKLAYAKLPFYKKWYRKAVKFLNTTAGW